MKRDSKGRFVKLEVKMDAGVISKEQNAQAAEPERKEAGPKRAAGGRRKKSERPIKAEASAAAEARGSVPSAEEFRVRAKGLAVQALERLGEIALGEEVGAQHAIPAGKAIIEYAYGKAIADSAEQNGAIGRVDELLESITEAAQEE